MDQHVHHEVDLVARVARVVAGRPVRSAGEEEVGEPAAGDAEVRARAVGPVLLEREAVAATDAHPVERAGAEVETGRPHDDVELPLAVGGLDARCGDLRDRRRLEVDERHLRVVVRLVVVRAERRAALAVQMVRDQLRRRRGILDDAADLVGEELAPLGVDVLVGQQVRVVARHLREARAVPHLLVERPPLLPSCRRPMIGRTAGGGTRWRRC